MKTLFISGNDTDVGKTHVGTALVARLIAQGHRCVARKPIETGCDETAQWLIPSDAEAYYHACQQQFPLAEICPLRYVPAISPERAIRLAGETIHVCELVDLCQPATAADYLIVEGAGGLYSPLCSDGLNADLAQALDAQVLLVIGDRLGCINQTLLCLEALQQRHLKPVAVILNQVQLDDTPSMDNFDDLTRRLSLPVIIFPHASAPQQSSDDALSAITYLLESSNYE